MDATRPEASFPEDPSRVEEPGARPATGAPSLGECLENLPGAAESIVREMLALDADGEDLDPGTRDAGKIGRYVLHREVGRGGQGVVFEATDTRFGRRVALKVLESMGPRPAPMLERFRREAAVAARLDHPGICTVYDAGEDGGVPYIAMRFVDGESLAERISTAAMGSRDGRTACVIVPPGTAPESAEPAEGPGPPEGVPARAGLRRVVRLIADAARTLQAAHQAGIIHRDIKPGNIMVGPDGRAVIMDFGLARDESGEHPTVTRTGELFGTPAYMSPEQLTRQSIRVDGRTDVWSLGVTLYECLTLRRPFDAPTREKLYQAILTKDPPEPRRANPGIPRDLAVILDVALEKDLDRRYQTAGAFAGDLEAFLEDRPISARRLGPAGRLLRWSKREPAKAVLLATLLVTFPAIAALVADHLATRDEVRAARLQTLEEGKDAHLARGFFELGVGEGGPEAAIGSFRSARDLEGGSREAVAGIAMAHLALGRPEAALSTLDAHRESLSALRAAVLLRADALRLQGRAEDARAAEASAPEPREAIDFYLMGERLLHEGEGRTGRKEAFQEALPALREAAFLSTAPRALYFQALIHAAGHLQDVALVRQTARALTRHWPDTAASAYWRATALEHCGLHEEAFAAIQEALRLRPGLPMAHIKHARILRELGDLAGAARAVREAIRLEPSHHEWPAVLGTLLVESKSFDEAVSTLREVLDSMPDNGAVHNNLGVALEAQGLLDEALGSYREAVRLGPGVADHHRNLGDALRRRGRPGEAITAYRRCLELDPASARDHVRVGLSFEDQGSLDEALAAYRAALRAQSDCAPAWTGLGTMLAGKHAYGEAESAFREAIRIRPGDPVAHTNLGIVLRQLGRPEEAIAAAREAVRLGPERAEAHHVLASALAATERLDEAVAGLREAVRLAPGDIAAHGELAEVLTRIGRHAEVLEVFRQVRDLGRQRADWPSSMSGLLESAEGVMAEVEAVERHLAAGTEPETAEGLVRLAPLALDTGHPAIALRWFQTAFARDPALAGRIRGGHRFQAARAALRTSWPADGASAEGAAAAARALALEWLEADVTVFEERMDGAGIPREWLERTLEVWKRELPLLRDPEAVTTLPPGERDAWGQLVRRVNALSAALE